MEMEPGQPQEEQIATQQPAAADRDDRVIAKLDGMETNNVQRHEEVTGRLTTVETKIEDHENVIGRLEERVKALEFSVASGTLGDDSPAVQALARQLRQL